MELISYFALLHGVGVNVPAFDTVQSHNMHQKMIFSSCCFGKKKQLLAQMWQCVIVSSRSLESLS